jgi:hypothetical protein
MTSGAGARTAADEVSFERRVTFDPVLKGVVAAHDVVEGMTQKTILTSCPTMPFGDYTGG